MVAQWCRGIATQKRYDTYSTLFLFVHTTYAAPGGVQMASPTLATASSDFSVGTVTS